MSVAGVGWDWESAELLPLEPVDHAVEGVALPLTVAVAGQIPMGFQ